MTKFKTFQETQALPLATHTELKEVAAIAMKAMSAFIPDDGRHLTQSDYLLWAAEVGYTIHKTDQLEFFSLCQDARQNSPFATNDELELVAGLAMQELYMRFRDKGGRFLDWHCLNWARKAGYRIPQDKRQEFISLCESKWRLIIQYLETEYRLR